MTNDPRIEIVARALHEYAETHYVNRGMRLKWDNPIVDREGYLTEATAVIEALRGAAGVPEQAGRTETLIEHHESTLRGALMMARARYELAQEEFDRAAAEGRSVDTPRPRRQRPDRPRVVPRSWPAEFRPVYDDDFDSPSLPVVPPTPETQQ